MKKLVLSLLVLATIPSQAVSIKEKIKNLRKALKAHAESENKSWWLLEDLDKRVYQVENRLSGCPLPTAFDEKKEVAAPESRRKYQSRRPGLTGLSRRTKIKTKKKKSKKCERPGLTKLKKKIKHHKGCIHYSEDTKTQDEKKDHNRKKRKSHRPRLGRLHKNKKILPTKRQCKSRRPRLSRLHKNKKTLPTKRLCKRRRPRLSGLHKNKKTLPAKRQCKSRRPGLTKLRDI